MQYQSHETKAITKLNFTADIRNPFSATTNDT